MKKLIGAHLPIGKGLYTLQSKMENLNTQTCAFFIRSPRSFESKDLTSITINKFKENIKEPSILLPHAPYLINLANKDPKHIKVLQDDLIKCSQLGIKYYNLHPGSDVLNLGKEKAIKQISDQINQLKNDSVVIVLENLAGDGKKVGNTFEELRDIIENVKDKSLIGVCLDTCHLFGYGYDIRTEEKFENVMNEFDRIVGLKYLKGMHLNDSKMPLGSKKDRHESIGKGKIGLDAFKYIMKSDYFDNIPMILETPDPSIYQEEIDLLRSFEK